MNIDEMQAGPEIDALVAEKVMGWEQLNAWWWQPKDNSRAECPVNLWHPSTDIAAASLVRLALCQNGYSAVLEIGEPDELYARASFAGRTMVFAEAETAPLAICRAALKAILGIDRTG